MTQILSATSATTPMSWVIRIRPSFISCCRSASSCITWACTVTSRAVVGSSAMMMSGLSASAIAIITRCRMPPENWCGKSLTREAAAGMPTSSSISIAFALASLRLAPWCLRNSSPSCQPTVNTGFSDESASWKIIAILLART